MTSTKYTIREKVTKHIKTVSELQYNVA